MSILFMYAIKDRAADSFDRPFFLPSSGVAVRTFTSEVNRSATDNPFYQYPDDFDLYCVGTFDTRHATIESKVPAELVVRGKDVKTTACNDC